MPLQGGSKVGHLRFGRLCRYLHEVPVEVRHNDVDELGGKRIDALLDVLCDRSLADA